MPEHRMDPAALVWNWRRAEGKDSSQADEAKQNAAARKKGVIGGVVGLTVAAIIYFYFERPILAAVVAGIALVLTLLAFLAPAAHRKVQGLLDRFAHGVGMAVTWVLMTVLYYLLFLPVGLFLRARKRLAVTQHPDRRLPSYWSSTEDRPWTAESYRKQF